KRSVVHIRRRQLHVAERRDAEGETIEFLVEELAATEVERRAAPRPGAELRHAGIGEPVPAEQGPRMTAAAARFVAEEEQRPALLLRGQGGRAAPAGVLKKPAPTPDTRPSRNR